MKSETWPVAGMHCAGCAKAVELTVKNLEGVTSANVNIATEKLALEYDPEKLSVDSLEAAVRDAGYTLVREDLKKKQ